MIITNTATSTIIAIVGGKRLELKYNQSANVPEKDGALLLKLFSGLKAETVVEAKAEPIIEKKPQPKAKRNVKGKKSGK